MVLQGFLGFRTSLCVPDTNVFHCAWGRGTRKEPLPAITPGALAFSTTLTLLVEKAGVVPIYRRKKQPRRNDWPEQAVTSIFTTILKAPTP